MREKSFFFACCIILLILNGCSAPQSGDIPSFLVQRSDFSDDLVVEGTVESVYTTNVFCPPEVQGIVVYMVQDGTYVQEGDVLCEIEDQDLDNEYESALLSLENALAELNKVKVDLELKVALLEADVKSNEAAANIANLDSLQLQYSSENQRKIQELELQKTAIQKNKIETKLRTLRVIHQTELKKHELRIERHNNRIEKLHERMESLVIKSPKSGLATRSVHWLTGKKILEGDRVWEGLPLIVIPDMEEVKVRLKASESEYKQMNPGNRVTYTFDAMPELRAFGEIVMKTPVGSPLGPGSKVKYFEVEASVDSAEVLIPLGLSAICNIHLEQIKDTIVVPRIAIFEEDSAKVVYVKKNKFYEMRQIITTNSSLKSAVVAAGLVEQDQIALLKPPSSNIKIKTFLPDSVVRLFQANRADQSLVVSPELHNE